MNRFLKLPLFALLVLAALSFSDAAEARAQGKGHGKHHKEAYDKKGGPPAWAPAHGHRRKMAEANHQHNDRRWSSREEALRQRERELARREAALKRKEKALKGDTRHTNDDRYKKGRSNEELKKRRIPQDSPSRAEEELKRRQEEKMRQKQEVLKKRLPGL